MMKTAGAITVVRLMISFFLVAITPSGVVVGQNEPVLDILGQPVKANARYRIILQNAIPGRAYITRHATGTRQNPHCLRQVVKVTTLVSTATRIPVQFLSSSDVVRVDTEVNIRFVPTNCPDSFWKVERETGAVIMTRSLSSTDSNFIIRKSGKFYYLAFSNAGNATNIDIMKSRNGSGILGLILGKFGFLVFFVPA